MAFASAQDYELRYGEVEDEDRLLALLDDASAFLCAQSGFKLKPDDEVQRANLVRITCAVVRRSLSAGAWAGLANVSQGAGGYSASATVYNPGGDFYLTKAERRALGISGGRVGVTDPYGEVGRDDAADA